MALKYVPIQTFEAKQLSVNLLDDPDDFYMHNRRYAMSVILQFVYGRHVPVCKNSPQLHRYNLTCRGLLGNSPNFRGIEEIRVVSPSWILAG